ncbi:MAG: NAD+ synthase [Nitrospinae bacterium]|nr:NAD+ synthase [Nitrospinota bacterium]
MKIALAQINPTIGDFKGNMEKIERSCALARDAGADLTVFSELVLSGYPPRDLLNKPEFVEQGQKALEGLISRLRGPAVLCGHYERTDGNSGLANAATLFQNGKILARTRKILLPTYDVFDELRYFQPGESVCVCPFRGVKLGIGICEDIWNLKGFREIEGYSRNPVEEMIQSGAEIIINLSASPYRIGRRELRLDLGRTIVRQQGCPFVLVNQVGGNDDLLFDGHSFALSAGGETIAQASGFKEDLVMCDTASGSGEIRSLPENEEAEVAAALVMGVRDYLTKCGYKKAVVGLSGGIDSSVVAVLAVEALGPENVMGVSMPSPYTAPESVEDARILAQNLGIRFDVVPIADLFEAYKSTLKPVFSGLAEDVTEENIQARIRGNILMAISNKLAHMVLSTGNKSEMAVGYCTLYGDMAGGLAVISDIPKTKVYALARKMNKEREIIPRRVLTSAPTAELRPNQTDQDSLPPYDILDAIVERYVEKRQSADEIVRQGFPADIVKRVLSLVDNNEYKRKQAAPGLKITQKAFGTGRRFPMAQKFKPYI